MPLTRLLAFMLLVLASRVSAAEYYALSPAIIEAYEDILSLETDRALATLKSIKANDADNLAVLHLESYVDFFRLYLTEDEDYFDDSEAAYEQRLAALERLSDDSPWSRYVRAEVRLHRALLLFRFESYLPAFREVNKAHKLLRGNVKEFPDFLPTYKGLGLLHAAVGSIPPQYKWGVELFSSLNGSIEQGRREMEKAMSDRSHPFYRETVVLYALLRLHLANEPEAAWRIVNELSLSPRTNKLHCFVLANVAMRSGRNDRAIALLEAQPRGGSAEDFAYLDFMLGLAKIRKLDYSARIYLQSFLLRFRGRHFVKEAVQKIAWAELLRGRSDLYRERMREVDQKGASLAGGDVNATQEAAAQDLPHSDLLRARLLFDGGYFRRALGVMDGLDATSLTTPELELEYHYRTGRILHGLEDYPGALSFYERTIDLGKAASTHFACSAALQAGLVEEKRGHTPRAKAYFERCLSLYPDAYRMGLHIQAKAGLNRLKS